MKIGKYVEWHRSVGEPIYRKEDRIIRPISRVLKIWWQPFGGRVWNWPVAVAVEQDGTVQEMPITNVNLLAQIGIGLMFAVAGLFIWMTGKNFFNIKE